MRPESPAYLWDAREAARRITEFIQGRTSADYDADILLQSAVERQFIIVGEALNRLDKIDADTAADVPHLRQIVGFRNILVHGYAEIRHDRVWDIAAHWLARLIESLDDLLKDHE